MSWSSHSSVERESVCDETARGTPFLLDSIVPHRARKSQQVSWERSEDRISLRPDTLRALYERIERDRRRPDREKKGPREGTTVSERNRLEGSFSPFDRSLEDRRFICLFHRARRPFVPLNATFKGPEIKGQEEKRTRTPAAAKRTFLFFLADPALAPAGCFDIKSALDMMSWLAILPTDFLSP